LPGEESYVYDCETDSSEEEETAAAETTGASAKRRKKRKKRTVSLKEQRNKNVRYFIVTEIWF